MGNKKERLKCKLKTLFGLVAVTCCVMVGVYVRFRQYGVYEFIQRVNPFKVVGNDTAYLVNTAKCQIPYLDPMDMSIRKYFIFPDNRKLECPTKWTLTYIKDNKIHINQTVMKKSYNDTITSCWADALIRKNVSDDAVQYGNAVNINSSGVDLTAEFTRVRCYNSMSKTIYLNVYVKNVRKNEADKRFIETFPKHKQTVNETYNVMMVMIDTQSRMNFQRYMTETRAFLLGELNAAEYVGYNVVGENTFPNLVAQLAGKYFADLPFDEAWPVERKTFDKFQFMFNEYQNAGYTTMLAEDSPNIATFNYIKSGFIKQPVDYYFRPMALEMERFKERRWDDYNCFYERREQSIILDYMDKFIRSNVQDKQPFFGLVILTRMTHDSMTNAAYLDDMHMPVITRLHEDNALNNTFFIYYSDHGYRWGDYRATRFGGLEHRLPLLYIAPPRSFKHKYPQLWSNIQLNAHKLTSPFDFYVTLHDILHFRSAGTLVKHNGNKFGLSFLRDIRTRSCHEAGIPYQWCACPKKTKISTDLPIVSAVAKYYVDHLNTMVGNDSDVCETLRVANITDAGVILDIKQTFYKIKVETMPGAGLFEASVSVDEAGAFNTSGGISRLSFYGETSRCVTNTITRRICHCKEQKNSQTPHPKTTL